MIIIFTYILLKNTISFFIMLFIYFFLKINFYYFVILFSLFIKIKRFVVIKKMNIQNILDINGLFEGYKFSEYFLIYHMENYYYYNYLYLIVLKK